MCKSCAQSASPELHSSAALQQLVRRQGLSVLRLCRVCSCARVSTAQDSLILQHAGPDRLASAAGQPYGASQVSMHRAAACQNRASAD